MIMERPYQCRGRYRIKLALQGLERPPFESATLRKADQFGPLRPMRIYPALGHWVGSFSRAVFPGLWLEEAAYTLRSLEGWLAA